MLSIPATHPLAAAFKGLSRLHSTMFIRPNINNRQQYTSIMNGSKSHSPVDSTDPVPVASAICAARINSIAPISKHRRGQNRIHLLHLQILTSSGKRGGGPYQPPAINPKPTPSRDSREGNFLVDMSFSLEKMDEAMMKP